MIRTATVSVRQALGAAVSVRGAATPTICTATRIPPSFKALSTSVQPAEEKAINWRFPADDRTQGMVASVEHGVSQTNVITCNSKAPITPDLMEEALTHLYNKIESLRLCLRLRDGQPWIAEMPQRKLDFQVISGTDLDEEHYNIIRSPFNLHEGPFWKARLMPCPEDAPCDVPEVKAAFPHQCHVLMSIHHAFNDGIVVLKMREVLLQIIDSLLEGEPVDTKPVGELRDGVETREEENRIRAELEKNPERLLAALRKHETNKHLPVLMEAYGVLNEPNPTTRYVKPIVLDVDMEKLTAKCRSIGVSPNACFTAILNMSTMEVAREAGLERDVYNISNRVPVDSRRLMKNTKSLPLGFHAIPFTQCTPTPRNVKKYFWQYVQLLDTELRQKLKGNYMCEQRVLEEMMRPEGFTHEGKYLTRQLPDCDFLFSNLYIPNAPKQTGRNIQTTEDGNYMGFNKENFAVAQGIFTTRGQPRLQIAHSTATVTRKVMERCQEKNFAMFHDVCKMVD